MEQIIANLSGRARRAFLHQREHVVVPLTLIVPGVLNGSQGPLYYPLDEIQKATAAWNGMPIVVRHPQGSNGRHVSARTPEVLDKQGVGEIYNAKTNGKLTAEGWFDVERTERLDADLLRSIENGQVIALSTGLFTDNEISKGASPEGVSYDAVARNQRPDHLAILLDEQGACSVGDGCGVNVNAAKTEGGKSLSASAYAYVPDPEKPSTWKLRIDDAAHVGGAIAALGKGFRGQRVQLPAGALKSVKAKVRAAWLRFHPNKTRQDLPTILRNQKEKTMSLSPEKRDEIVDGLIANVCCWDEEDRTELLEMTDNPLFKLQQQGVEHSKALKEQQTVTNAATKGFTDSGGTAHSWSEKTQTWESNMKEKEKEVVANRKEEELQTTEEWLEKAPEEVRNTFQYAQSIEAREKGVLIDRLTENATEETKPGQVERLEKRTLAELQADVALLPEPKQSAPALNFVGAAPAVNAAQKEFPPMPMTSDYEDH